MSAEQMTEDGGQRLEARPGGSAEEFTQVGGEVFVNESARSGVDYFQATGLIAIDKPVLADPQPVKPSELVGQRLGVAPGQ